MRSILVAIAIVAAPLTAPANPIPYDFLTVTYEGTVSSIDPWGARGFPGAPQIGDSISGTLRVDLRGLPPDIYSADPSVASHVADGHGFPSFVSGYTPAHGESTDHLSLADNSVENGDVFSILDDEEWFRHRHGVQTDSRDSLGFFLFSKTLDVVHGDSAIQDFTITADSMAPGSAGELQKVRMDKAGDPIGRWLGGLVHFALKKVTVKPGRCPM